MSVRVIQAHTIAMLLALLSLGIQRSAVSLDTETHAAESSSQPTKDSSLPKRESAIFAGGCFWCVETDFEKAPGVVDVISGYSGGRTQEPTYENYAAGGHREVVFVMYDPTQISYAGLVEYLIKHIDPLNRYGQFNDPGVQYSPAIYHANEQEKADAERVIEAINQQRVFVGKISLAVLPRQPFWPAEEVHQDYHRKNPLKYQYFRLASGRDAFINSHWGVRAGKLELPGALPASDTTNDFSLAADSKSSPQPWLTFRKPSASQLRKKLTPLQYKITQQDGTEPAFNNTYWNNKKDGIYVDVVSGAPLFSSLAKFESGTGWPSFVAPIDNNAVTFKNDHKIFYTRVEVRSRYGDSHLGHVFDDGPVDRGGKRYCMNSAALRFVPKERMEEEGYGEYLALFDGQ